MSYFAARFERPAHLRAGRVGDPGSPGFEEYHWPCVGCWEEKELVGAIVDENHKVVIHVERNGHDLERSSPAYYCEPCWAREVGPYIASPDREADVTLATGGAAS